LDDERVAHPDGVEQNGVSDREKAREGLVASATEETDDELLARYPDVALDHTNKHFYRGLLHREVRLNRCSDCGWWHHRPKPICPNCWSRRVEATPIRGSGTIHLLIFLHQGPPADGVDYMTPHPVATVQLDEQEGLRFTSTVSGADNEEIAIGKRVHLDWTERNGRPHPVWRLGEGGSR
jgi:uncharacterized OB-fold protein